MDTITDILKKTVNSDALIIEPVNDAELKKCDIDLSDIGLLPLPAGYVQFLKLANGYAWNGFEFFGTYTCTEKATGYTLSDIVGFNEQIREKKGYSDDILVLGRFDEDIYIYNYTEESYKAIDRLTSIEADEFDSFEDLILSTVGLYVDSDDGDGYDDYDEDD